MGTQATENCRVHRTVVEVRDSFSDLWVEADSADFSLLKAEKAVLGTASDMDITDSIIIAVQSS